MAYNEILTAAIIVAILMLLMYVSFMRGRDKGETDSYQRAHDNGYAAGYLAGVQEGFVSYKSVDAEIYERTEQRAKATLEQTNKFIEELNEKLETADAFPPELLLAYGVSDVRDLPKDVRDAYGIKVNLGGVNNGTE